YFWQNYFLYFLPSLTLVKNDPSGRQVLPCISFTIAISGRSFLNLSQAIDENRPVHLASDLTVAMEIKELMQTEERFAIKIFLGVLSLVLLFHFLILFKVIPYEITWGGRLRNDTEMYIFETASIAINIFIIWVLLMKAAWVRYRFHEKVISFLLRFFLFLFTLNTIGNLFAATSLERMFSGIT